LLLEIKLLGLVQALGWLLLFYIRGETGKNGKIYDVGSDYFSCLFECVALSYSDPTVGSGS